MAGELKVGLIGLTGHAERMLEALLAEPRVQLVAVADRDRDAAERCAAACQAEAYTDFRSLIVEQPLDALFVATPHHATHGCLRQAAQKQLAVFKRPPLARRFDEALALTQAFEQAGDGGCPLVVARSWPAEPALRQTSDRLATLGRPFLVDARVMAVHAEDLGWRGDSESAGGGVLLNEAYDAFDMIVHWLGPPAAVFATTGRISRPQTRYPYDTEDSGVVTLRYADGAIASVVACWTSGPRAWELTLRCPDGTIRVDPGHICVMKRDGQLAGTPIDRAPNRYTHPMRAFLDGLSQPAARIASRGRDHLWTMAVLEAAYLSARTGEAESPAKWFEVLGADRHDVALPEHGQPSTTPQASLESTS